MRPTTLLALALAVATPTAAADLAAGTGEPLRISAQAFGETVAIEVRDLPRPQAEAAVRAALEEILEVEALTDPGAAAEGGLATVAAGGGPQRVDPRLAALLTRANRFCGWSQGAHGPLGGRLYRLWSARGPVDGRPTPAALVAAAESARCDALAVDPATATVTLAEGSEIDLGRFAAGFAVDRATDALAAAGAGDGVVAIGGIARAFGPGPGGSGWPVTLPQFSGLDEPLGRVWLRDGALAWVRADRGRLEIAGDDYAPLIDQRSGQPVKGAVATVAASELAIDAQALAGAVFVLGNRESTFRLGSLKPVPAVLWLLGSGRGQPLLASYHWSTLDFEAQPPDDGG